MRVLRAFAQGQHWRPLLDTPRAVLSDYAQRHGLNWIDDPSNADTHHDRNFLRQKIMPVLRERWPQAGAALARSAMLLSEHEALLEEQTASRLAQVQGVDPNTLSVPALRQFGAPWRALIFRRWTAALNLPTLPAAGIENIERQLLTARQDASAEFRWHGATIRRWRDLLYAETWISDLPSDWRATWDGDQPLPLPTGGELRFVQTETAADAGARGPLLVRTRQGGERIVLPGRTHSHSLKNVLQEFGVPPWQRKRLPLIFAPDGELLAVGDVLRSARAHAAGWSFRLDNMPGDP